jgi:hypothetical protein
VEARAAVLGDTHPTGMAAQWACHGLVEHFNIAT